MKNIYSHICLVLTYCGIALFLSSCFTVHTHQTAKTLGKGEFKKTLITGLSGAPNFSDEPYNNGNGPIMFPNYTYQFGIGEFSDIGAFLGITKTGAFYKHQLLGDQNSKGAFSIGVNAFLGMDLFLFSYSLGYVRSEIPLYLSYELTHKIILYASPMLAYNWVEKGWLFQYEVTNYHYLTRGLTFGCMFDLGDKFTLSPEIAAQNLWNTDEYQFYTTIGFGIKLSRPYKVFNFPF